MNLLGVLRASQSRMKKLPYTELEQESSSISKLVANTSCKLKADKRQKGVRVFTVHFLRLCPKQSALIVGCTFVISK